MTAFGKLVVAGVLVALVALGVGVYLLHKGVAPVPAQAPFVPVSATSTSTLSADVYPIYGGAMWHTPVATTMTVGTSSVSGFEATSTTSASTSNIASTTAPFVTYYDTKLTAAGWSQDTQLDADGAGSSMRVYKKGTQVIVIGYTSTFANISEDVPAQCPCTVSFSIFTSGFTSQ